MMFEKIRSKRVWIVVTVVIALLSLTGWLWLSRPFLSSNIRRQVSFVVFYPGKNDLAKADRSTIKYDSSQHILTYMAELQSTTLTITNQATPDQFNDIPQFYDKVIAGMNGYNKFDTKVGKVDLARPSSVNGRQVAVINTTGTLMFVRADHDLSDDQWRQFFNNLATFK